MTVGELKECLEMFSDEKDISILINDSSYDEVYEISGISIDKHSIIYILAE